MSRLDMPELCEEIKQRFNEPILIGLNVCRLIGYAEDSMDCYLIVKSRDRTFWNTMVGGYTYLDCLKQQGVVTAHNGEIWNDYTRLDSELEGEGISKETEFQVVINHGEDESC